MQKASRLSESIDETRTELAAAKTELNALHPKIASAEAVAAARDTRIADLEEQLHGQTLDDGGAHAEKGDPADVADLRASLKAVEAERDASQQSAVS